MATDPFLGRVLGRRYVIQEKLGRGGMGAVYRAQQQPLGRDVAVKVLNERLSGDPVAHERFRAEARAIAALQHPHVVSLHDFDVDGDVMFLVLELMSGNDLRHALSQGRLNPIRALYIVRDIARALVAAHEKKILHRDLKPENVFLVTSAGTDEHAKVIDFGIAKLARSHDDAGHVATLDAITDSGLTEEGMLPGTPGYVSPERLMGRGADDPRSDLYALGVTWFEMLTGHRPHHASVPMQEVLDALNNEVATLASQGVTDVPDNHEALLRRLLARDPDARVGSALELLRDIERIANFTPTPQSGALLGAAALVAAYQAGTPYPPPHQPISYSPTLSTPHLSNVPTGGAAASPNDTVATRGSSSLPSPPPRPRRRVAVVAAVALAAVGAASAVVLAQRPATIETIPVERALRDDVSHVLDTLADGDLVAAARDASELHRTAPAEPSPQVLAAVTALVDGDEDRFEALLDDVGRASTSSGPRATDDSALVAWLTRFGDDDVAALSTALAADARLSDSFVAHVALAAVGVERSPRAFAAVVDGALDRAAARRPGTALVPLLRSTERQRRGDAAGAHEAARVGLGEHPLSVELKLALVRALQAQSKLAEAQRVVDEVYREQSTPAVRLARASLLALRAGPAVDDDHDEAEQQRVRLMADLLAPDMARESRARAALAHAEVLLFDAGRHGDAEVLIQRVIDDARAAADVVVVARATLLSARGGWLLNHGHDELLQRRTAELRALAAEPALSERALRLLRGDARLFEGLVAVRDGDLPAARRILDDLRSHADRLRFRAGPQATDELAFSVAGASGDAPAAQALATSLWSSACERERALAIVDAGRGDLAAARAAFAKANADVAGCRAAGHTAGVVVSLVLEARLALADGDTATAKDRLDVLVQTLPRLDPALALAADATRMREQLAAPGRSASPSPPSPPSP